MSDFVLFILILSIGLTIRALIHWRDEWKQANDETEGGPRGRH
jgi:hypothetical protein